MAKEASFDIVSEFDFQEMRNATEQVKKEVTTRYDLKGADITIELNEDDIAVTAENVMQTQAVESILLQKIVNRGISTKVLDSQAHETIGGGKIKQVYKLKKALDQDTAKKISAKIRDQKLKVKASIQGNAVRVSGKSKDDLQAVMAFLKSCEDIEAPLQFTNYR